tara:strand:+ start:357 stop:539 length:183 start_codon:yes stop_codon:yes gene_type:complete
MDRNTKLPKVDKLLVEKLEDLFPEQSADLQWSEKEVWYKAGQRSVIRFLHEIIKEQEEDK